MASSIEPPVRLGMIGCGLISHAHGGAALKSDQQIQFSACASRNLQTAQAWAKTYGCRRVYSNYSDMLQQEQLDGVVIATWPTDHREHVEAALTADVRYILCEKSLTTSGKDALAIWRAAQEQQAQVMEAFMYRHHPAMAEVRRILAAGELGAIDSIRGTFDMLMSEQRPDGTMNWRQQPAMGGGVTYDFTCYAVDALNAFAGALPARVSALGSTNETTGVLDRLVGHVLYENDVIGSIQSSHRASFSQALEINGARGRIALPVAWSIRDDAIIRRARVGGFLEYSEEEQRIPQSEPHDGRLVDLPVFVAQLENFVAVIRGKATPLITLNESVINACVLDALLESNQRRCAIEVAIPMEIRASMETETKC